MEYELINPVTYVVFNGSCYYIAPKCEVDELKESEDFENYEISKESYTDIDEAQRVCDEKNLQIGLC